MNSVAAGRFWIMMLIGWLVGLAGPGQAADSSPSHNAVRLDTVVVSASDLGEAVLTGDVDVQTTPANVSVIRRAEFEGKTEDLAQVIEREVGVQVRQSGGLGSFSTVSLRGSSSEQVMIFLDGILLNDASGGGVDLSQIALSDVAAIEIYRGVTPINFGKASIGGVVNIRTLRAGSGLNASAAAGYGSFQTRTFSALVNHKPSRWDYLLSADYLAADNDYEIVNDQGTWLNPHDDRTEKLNNAQVEQVNLLAKTGYDLSDRVRIDFLNQYFNKRQGLTSRNNDPVTRAALDTARNITTLSLTADGLTPLMLNTRTQVSYTWKEEEYNDRLSQIGLDRQHNTYTTRRVGLDFFGEYLTGQHDIVLSTGVSNETYQTANHLSASDPGDSRRTYLSLGLQDSMFFLDERLIVTPAVRNTWISDEFDSEGGASQGTDSYLNPQIGITYQAARWLTLRSNLARYVREPSFFELFGDRGFFIPNPDLEAESGVNFDLGATIDWQPAGPWMQRLTVTGTYFRSAVEDLITRTYDSRGIGKSVNISNALIQGIEVAAAAEFLDYFRAVFNATFQDPQNQSGLDGADGKMLTGRFANSYLGRLEARFGPVMVYGEYLRQSNGYYDLFNQHRFKDKNEVNAGASWLWRSLKLTVEGRNLGDESYEDFHGYPLSGRSLFASVKYEFE